MFTRLNAYDIMWLFVFFDLPTNTKQERKFASGFRRDLLKDGYCMLQYSVYVRHCGSKTKCRCTHKKSEILFTAKQVRSAFCK